MINLLFSALVLLLGTLFQINPVLEVTNIKEAGNLYIAIYQNEKDFLNPSTAFQSKIQAVKKGTTKIHLEKLPMGTYAIALFVDVNGNGALDKNFLGIPSEQYGFSGKDLPKMRAPKFKEAAVNINQPNTIIQIKLN